MKKYFILFVLASFSVTALCEDHVPNAVMPNNMSMDHMVQAFNSCVDYSILNGSTKGWARIYCSCLGDHATVHQRANLSKEESVKVAEDGVNTCNKYMTAGIVVEKNWKDK